MPQKGADKPNRQVDMLAHQMRRGTRIKMIKEILRNFYVFFARQWSLCRNIIAAIIVVVIQFVKLPALATYVCKYVAHQLKY